MTTKTDNKTIPEKPNQRGFLAHLNAIRTLANRFVAVAIAALESRYEAQARAVVGEKYVRSARDIVRWGFNQRFVWILGKRHRIRVPRLRNRATGEEVQFGPQNEKRQRVTLTSPQGLFRSWELALDGRDEEAGLAALSAFGWAGAPLEPALLTRVRGVFETLRQDSRPLAELQTVVIETLTESKTSVVWNLSSPHAPALVAPLSCGHSPALRPETAMDALRKRRIPLAANALLIFKNANETKSYRVSSRSAACRKTDAERPVIHHPHQKG